MSELKWNWVYYPYLDAPNKQEESALKAKADKLLSCLKYLVAHARPYQGLPTEESSSRNREGV